MILLVNYPPCLRPRPHIPFSLGFKFASCTRDWYSRPRCLLFPSRKRSATLCVPLRWSLEPQMIRSMPMAKRPWAGRPFTPPPSQLQRCKLSNKTNSDAANLANPSLQAFVSDKSSLQDHLIQRSLDIRGPGIVTCTEIVRRVEAYDQTHVSRDSQGGTQNQDQKATRNRGSEKEGKCQS
jgi:hypothetical protein